MTTTATPTLMINDSYNYGLFRDYQDRAILYLGDYPLSPDFQTPIVDKPTTNPDGRTTATTTITSGALSGDTTAAQTSSTITYHDSFSGGGRDGTGNESRWGRFRQEPLRLHDQFMARNLNIHMYLAEVTTAGIVSAFLFGGCRPRYYQRARKNRINWRIHRRFRVFRMNAADVIMSIWDACIQLHETVYLRQDEVSGPTYQMISNIHLIEYPATLSTFADIPTYEVIATVASARCSVLVSIASTSASTSAFPDLSFVASRRPPVSPRQLLFPDAPGVSAVASCHLGASLPDAGLEIALRPADSPPSPLLLPASSSLTRPSLARSQWLPEAADGDMTLRAERPLTAMCPSAIAATTECAANNTSTPIVKTSNAEREWLAVVGVNLLLEGLSLPCPTTSPATRIYRPTLVPADTDFGNAEGTVNTLARYNTAERNVTTAVEEFGGGHQAETADEAPPSPFFVSEHYTPESSCFVSAHGVACATIIMSYTHQSNHPTWRDSQEDTPTTTQAGDVSDILWPAMNARLRCKWSQACIQTTSSEYYRSSVEAVFASCFIPDEPEMALLNDLVRKHL